MLDALISSGTRRRILKAFLSSPQQKFYVRQLASELKISVGTVHRELVKLEHSGILRSQKLGNLRMFSCNPSLPLFDELKKLIFKTEGIAGSLQAILARHKGIAFGFLYGSFARNEEDADSDVDMALVGTFARSVILEEIRKLEKLLRREINFSSYTKQEFKREKQKKGSFLHEVLNGPIIVLKGNLDAA